MPKGSALEQAVQLLGTPSLAGAAQRAALPDEIAFFLQILARNPDAESRAAEQTGKSVEKIREAAEFYAQQVFFALNADHYRALAASPEATRVQLRTNMVWLLRWLHPDLRHCENHSLYFGRVMQAWDVLGSPERRAEYDRAIVAALPRPGRGGVRQPAGRVPIFRSHPNRVPLAAQGQRSRRRRFWHRIRRLALLGTVLVLAWTAWMHPQWLDRVGKLDWLFGQIGDSPSRRIEACANFTLFFAAEERLPR